MPKSPLELAYNKQLRRIKSFIKSAEKRGYEFPANVIPPKPKKITEKSVERLKNITPDVLYKKAKYTTDKGKKISGTKRRQQERKESAKKAAETRLKNLESKELTTQRQKYYSSTDRDSGYTEAPADIDKVLRTIEEMIEQWEPRSWWNSNFADIKRQDCATLRGTLNGAIASLGRETVARNCEKNADEIKALADEILYGSGSKEYHFGTGRQQVNFDLVRFRNLIYSRPMTVQESAEFTEARESFEYEE